MEQFSFKELYDVSLKATYPFDFGDRHISKGEVVAMFDKIIIANFKEVTSHITAHGGYNDATLVSWETTKEININFTQGVFSKEQFSLLNNARLLENANIGRPLISKREKTNSDENNQIQLEFSPVDLFVYDENYQKIEYEKVSEKIISVDKPYKKVIIDYTYEYDNKVSAVKIGQKLLSGYLELEGKIHYKDDELGHVRTGIIKIPKLKLVSELSMKLGEYASPIVGSMNAIGYPIGIRGRQIVMEIFFLEDDLDSDV